VEEQSFAKHARFVPLFHFFLLPLLLLTFIGAAITLVHALLDHRGRHAAIFLASSTFAAIFIAFFARIFALKAQDRAIRAEENLRHFAMTGKLFDKRLTTRQIIGLRFASDEEFLDLARKAADENLSEKEIKKSVKNWRADHDRL